jgi:tetratricopeptide (TPR) repeat protein
VTAPVTDEEIQAWADGELPEADAERVLAAVLRDPRAAAQLEDCMQVRAIGAELGPGDARSSSGEPGDQIGRARRRRRPVSWVVGGTAALAAAVVAYCAAGRREEPAVETQVVAALGAQRLIEPRLAWPAADLYRSYDTERAAAAPRSEALPYELLAQIERAGDRRALAGVQLLGGNLERARGELERAPESADTWSDRAALELLAGEPERALAAADRALVLREAHAPAQWNRALALARLGLDRTAAEAFGSLAKRAELGWSV